MSIQAGGASVSTSSVYILLTLRSVRVSYIYSQRLFI